MAKQSKRMKGIFSVVDAEKTYDVKDAVKIIKDSSKVKFDETVEIVFNLNVDPKKADQMIRGIVSLPHGTGKKTSIVVLANENQEKEALEAGADYAGYKEYFDKIKNGWLDFDVLIVTPDLMKEVGKLGKVLGPKGLMPSPKSGTVTNNVKKAVEDIKKGKIDFRVDKNGNVAMGAGKISFGVEKLIDNVQSVIDVISKAKPSSVKGDFIKNISISSTMGPGLKINFNKI